MFDYHPKNDSHKLDRVYAHSEDLGNKIYRPQSGSSCWIPYMLSVHGEATHRGETYFLLVNGNHNVAHFFVIFPNYDDKCSVQNCIYALHRKKCF